MRGGGATPWLTRGHAMAWHGWYDPIRACGVRLHACTPPPSSPPRRVAPPPLFHSLSCVRVAWNEGGGRCGVVAHPHGMPGGVRWPGTGGTAPHERAMSVCTPVHDLRRHRLAATVRGPMCRVRRSSARVVEWGGVDAGRWRETMACPGACDGLARVVRPHTSVRCASARLSITSVAATPRRRCEVRHDTWHTHAQCASWGGR